MYTIHIYLKFLGFRLRAVRSDLLFGRTKDYIQGGGGGIYVATNPVFPTNLVKKDIKIVILVRQRKHFNFISYLYVEAKVCNFLC